MINPIHKARSLATSICMGRQRMRTFLFAAGILLFFAGSAFAQYDSVGNQYIYASMAEGTGQFTIINRSDNNGFLFGDGTTSHMNLRFLLGSGADTVVTNSIFTASNNAL